MGWGFGQAIARSANNRWWAFALRLAFFVMLATIIAKPYTSAIQAKSILKTFYVGELIGLNKLLIGIGAFLGSTLGSYLPILWGGSLFSLASVFLGTVGGIAGIIVAYRLSKYLGFI